MGEKGDEVQLLSFLNAVLGLNGSNRLVSVKILEDRKFSAEIIGGKACVFDVRAKLHDGTRVNIEVQLRNQGNMDRRNLYYLSREYAKNLEAGQDYRELPNVISINIVDFDFLSVENFHSVFHLREDKERDFILTNALEIHYLDMVKFRRLGKKAFQNEPLHRWLAWLDPRSQKELGKEEVGMNEAILEMDEGIRKAQEKLDYLSGDKDFLEMYELREKAIRDWNSSINYAHQEGKVEGITEATLKIARKMKDSGRQISEIEEFTGLAPQDIERL